MTSTEMQPPFFERDGASAFEKKNVVGKINVYYWGDSSVISTQKYLSYYLIIPSSLHRSFIIRRFPFPSSD